MLAAALAKHLDGLGIVTFDPTGRAGDCFVATMPAGPDEAVAVMPQPGLPQLTRSPHDLPGVQFLVRGPAHDPRPPYARARAIYEALTCLDLVTLDEGGVDEVYLVSLTAAQSEPVPIGQDDNHRHEWSVNFLARTYAPTAHRTPA